MRSALSSANEDGGSRGTMASKTTAGLPPRVVSDRARFEQHLAKAVYREDSSTAGSPPHARSRSPTTGPSHSTGAALPFLKSPLNPSSLEMTTSTSVAMGTASHSRMDVPASNNSLDGTGSPSDLSPNVANLQRTLRVKDKELAHLRRTVQELSSQLNNTLVTLDQRADTSTELEELKQTGHATQVRRDEGLRNARLEVLESRVRYRAMEMQLTAAYESDVQTKATELLEPHTKEVHAQNFELLKEKLLLAQEVATMRSTLGEMRERHDKMRRETDLGSDAAREMLLRSVAQKDEIAALRQQVRASEDNLDAVVAQYEKRLQKGAKEAQATIAAITQERDSARHDAVLLKRELVQLRTTASSVLAQRTELESFFYAALEEVRQEVVEERRHLLVDNMPASRSGNARQSITAHTTSSILRMEGKERLMLTDGPGTALVALPPSSGWTVDKKGFPKRIAAPPAATASSTRRHTPTQPAGGGHPAKRNTAAPSDVAASATLISLPHATPAYMRSGRDTAPLTTSGVAHAATTLGEDDSVPFRLGGHMGADEDGTAAAAAAAAAEAAPSASPPEEDALSEATGTVEELPLLRSLPTAPTWRDVKRVDVRELRWADKERVIQLLFKRLRQEGRRQAAMSSRQPTADCSVAEAAAAEEPQPVEELMPHPTEVGHDSMTFLTQQ